jgi:hypothetical protein
VVGRARRVKTQVEHPPALKEPRLSGTALPGWPNSILAVGTSVGHRPARELVISQAAHGEEPPHSRKQSERLDVVGTDDREVPPVDGRDLGHAQALGRGDDRRIDGAQRQIAVSRDQLGDPQPVRGGDRFDGECARRQVTQKADFRLCSEASRKQIDDPGDDERRDDKRAGVSFEQLERGVVVSVIGVDVGIERPGVDDERGYCATSAARISSIRSETSLRPLRPAAAAPNRRRMDGCPR